MRTALCAGAITCLCLWMISYTCAAAPDDLKGYSIEVTGTRSELYRNERNVGAHPPAVLVKFDERIYIGLTGNVFEYVHQNAPNGSYQLQDSIVSALNKATPLSRGRMRAWTFESGQLTGITTEDEGFLIRTITIDLSRPTCTFAYSIQPDPKTGRLVVQRFPEDPAEVLIFKVIDQTCRVTKGNIFAADQ